MSLGILSAAKVSLQRPYVRLAVLSSIVLAIAVSTSLLVSTPRKAAPAADLPQPVPALSFKDATGQPLTLADFRGRVVLLNIWATWCAPCRKEMPDLDRLEAELGAPGFLVLALSIDRGGLERVKKFFDETAIQHLAIYLDQQSAAMSVLAITGVPTTLLIDRDGREVRRWVGPAEWSSPEFRSLIRQQLDPAVSRIETPSSNSKVTL
jgi:thiol-disulfide isomerase/thioredoxin